MSYAFTCSGDIMLETIKELPMQALKGAIYVSAYLPFKEGTEMFYYNIVEKMASGGPSMQEMLMGTASIIAGTAASWKMEDIASQAMDCIDNLCKSYSGVNSR